MRPTGPSRNARAIILDAGAWGLAGALIAKAVNRPLALAGGVCRGHPPGKTLGAGRDLAPDLPGRGMSASPSASGLVGSATSMSTSARTQPAWRCCAAGSADPLTVSRSMGPKNSMHRDNLPCAEKIHHAAFVVAISQFTRSQLCRWAASADWRKIHVIHCGLDEIFLSSALTPIPEQARAGQHRSSV